MVAFKFTETASDCSLLVRLSKKAEIQKLEMAVEQKYLRKVLEIILISGDGTLSWVSRGTVSV